jgi:SAM-dependent MidA family methyltransferase
MIAALHHRLTEEGRLTFREFMRLALYDPREGYYAAARERFGVRGDFYTASQVHELFGALLAEDLAGVWRELGSPPDFTILELGAGRGELARDALTALRDKQAACFQSARYLICEISERLRAEQQARLAGCAARVEWICGLDELASPITGVIFSNEFFDALPVHLVRQRAGRLRELYVELSSDGSLQFYEGELSSAALNRYWQRAGAPLEEGQRAEINLEAARWIEQVARALARGRVITIDYGDTAERLYTPDRREGTLRCFHRHTLTDRPLERIGEQDITASVNFTALMEYGGAAGLKARSFMRQTDYLTGLGLLERAAELAEQAAGESPRAMQHRLALKQLFVPQGIAAYFKVLTQDKAIC